MMAIVPSFGSILYAVRNHRFCGVRCILSRFKGMLDAMWQTAAYWMMVCGKTTH